MEGYVRRSRLARPCSAYDPERLVDKFIDAPGKEYTQCFTPGAGLSGTTVLGGLILVQDFAYAWNYVPEKLVNLYRFRDDLANTAGLLTIDETIQGGGWQPAPLLQSQLRDAVQCFAPCLHPPFLADDTSAKPTWCETGGWALLRAVRDREQRLNGSRVIFLDHHPPYEPLSIDPSGGRGA